MTNDSLLYEKGCISFFCEFLFMPRALLKKTFAYLFVRPIPPTTYFGITYL